jgi:hypothetical protein
MNVSRECHKFVVDKSCEHQITLELVSIKIHSSRQLGFADESVSQKIYISFLVFGFLLIGSPLSGVVSSFRIDLYVFGCFPYSVIYYFLTTDANLGDFLPWSDVKEYCRFQAHYHMLIADFIYLIFYENSFLKYNI